MLLKTSFFHSDDDDDDDVDAQAVPQLRESSRIERAKALGEKFDLQEAQTAD